MGGMRPSGQSRSSSGRRGERSSFMPEEFEDSGELLDEIREHQRLTGTEPQEGSNGMTRRDLLVKGGVAAAGLSTVGALAGRAAAAPAKTEAVTLRVIALGVGWTQAAGQKST